MGVLAMLELDGDTATLLAAADRLETLLPRSEGLLARIVAPTETGIVLFQLWESVEARERHAANVDHRTALEESGLLAAVTARRSRVFEGAELR